MRTSAVSPRTRARIRALGSWRWRAVCEHCKAIWWARDRIHCGVCDCGERGIMFIKV